MERSKQATWHRSSLGVMAIVALIAVLGSAPRARAQVNCIGDCSGDNSVTVDEIGTVVSIALGTVPPSACTKGLNGSATVTEINTAVFYALNGCPVIATAACGDGHMDQGEDCDEGGTCIGGTNAGTHCSVGDSTCQGNGVCQGGSKAEWACADDNGCPDGGKCVHCVTFTTTTCAANCTSVTVVPFNLVPGKLLAGSLKNGTSGANVINEPLGPIPLPLSGGSMYLIGKQKSGQIPIANIAASVLFPKIDVQGLACACVRGIAARTCGGTLFNADGSGAANCTPGYTAGDSVCAGLAPCTFVNGEGNSASGVVQCAGELAGVDLTFTEDSLGSADPAECNPNDASFTPGLSFPTCGAPPIVKLSGMGGPGSAVILNSTAIGQALGGCSNQPPTYCTDADPFDTRGAPTTLPSVTGNACGEMTNINQTDDDTLCNCGPGVNSCALADCQGLICITGQGISCDTLAGGTSGGAAIAGAFTALSQSTIGDIVVTNFLKSCIHGVDCCTKDADCPQVGGATKCVSDVCVPK